MKEHRYWSPYAAGALLGCTLLATFIITGRGLGASSSIAILTAEGAYTLFPDFVSRLQYFSQYVNIIAPLINWNIFMMIGVLAGALAGALVSRGFSVRFERGPGMSIRVRLFTAFSGGMLIGFAARLARGCSSGVALSGGAQLAVAGWVFVIAMFAAGFATAALFRRIWS